MKHTPAHGNVCLLFDFLAESLRAVFPVCRRGEVNGIREITTRK